MGRGLRLRRAVARSLLCDSWCGICKPANPERQPTETLNTASDRHQHHEVYHLLNYPTTSNPPPKPETQKKNSHYSTTPHTPHTSSPSPSCPPLAQFHTSPLAYTAQTSRPESLLRRALSSVPPVKQAGSGRNPKGARCTWRLWRRGARRCVHCRCRSSEEGGGWRARRVCGGGWRTLWFWVVGFEGGLRWVWLGFVGC